MCIVLVALDAVPGWPLVVAANRDEMHERPSVPLAWWPDRPELVGGRDRRAGGTWMAVRRDGRFGTVLNDARVEPPPGARSRGTLVPQALDAPDLATAVARVGEARTRYAGFHLVLGAPGGGWYRDSHADPPRALSAGLHAVGNAGLDPGDPRLERGRELFRSALRRGVSREALLAVLADRSPVGAGHGDRRPVFIADEHFGTRCSTVFTVDENGRARVHERRFDAGARRLGDSLRRWRLAPAGESA